MKLPDDILKQYLENLISGNSVLQAALDKVSKMPEQDTSDLLQLLPVPNSKYPHQFNFDARHDRVDFVIPDITSVRTYRGVDLQVLDNLTPEQLEQVRVLGRKIQQEFFTEAVRTDELKQAKTIELGPDGKWHKSE